MTRKAAGSFNNSLRDKLLSVEQSDPKSFWNLISKIKDDHERETGNSLPNNISDVAKKYHTYFQNIFSKSNNETNYAATVFKSSLLPAHRDQDVMQFLNVNFTEEEVFLCISKLKSDKTSGVR